MAKITNRNVFYNSEHLKLGDLLPPYNGKPRLYNMRFCPFAHSAVLALNAKNIDYELINVHLTDKPQWIYEKNPLGKVPCLEVKDGVCIYESLIIAEYLDDAYAQKPLFPKDPIKKANDKIIVTVAGGAIQTLFIKLLKSPETITDQNVEDYRTSLDFIQEQLKQRGTVFLGGAEPGYADYMIWPWFEKIMSLQGEKDYETIIIDTVKYKLLLQYIDTMFKDPIVSEYAIPKSITVEFLKSYKTGSPNYKILKEF